MFDARILQPTSPHVVGRIIQRDVAPLRRMLRLALFVLMCATSAPAQANISCGLENVNLPLWAGTISVPFRAEVGQTIASVPPITFQMSCRFVNRVNPGTEATNYANFATTQLAPGFSDVYQTGTAGIGIRYTFDSARCNATRVVMTNGQARVGCYFSGPLDGPYQNANITVSPTLVVTGTLPPGTTALSSIPPVTILFTESDQTTSWVKDPLFTGAATGQFVHATCSVKEPNVYVSLQTANARAFSVGIGSVTPAQPFQLSLECARGAKVSITLTDSVSPDNRTNLLNLTHDSTARGIRIQILNSVGASVFFGADSAAPGNQNQWLIGDSPDGTLQVPMSARYVRTDAVTPGSVKALATFTMSYQ